VIDLATIRQRCLVLLARYREDQNPAKTMRYLEAAVVVVFVILLLWAVLGVLENWLSDGPTPLLPTADALAVEVLVLEQPLSEGSSEAMLDRPLFWEGRRALDDRPLELILPKSEPKKSVTKLEGVTLHGVFGTDGALGAIATVNGKTVRVAGGQPIKGWRLVSYQNGMAVFANGDSRQSLPLELVTPSVSLSREQEEAPARLAEMDPDTTAEQRRVEAERQQQLEQEERRRLEMSRAQGLSFGGGSATGRQKK